MDTSKRDISETERRRIIEAQPLLIWLSALGASQEFEHQIQQVRADPELANALASRYVRKDPGGRRDLMARILLDCAARGRHWKMGLYPRGTFAIFTSAPPEPGTPRYRMRQDAARTYRRASLRFVRRGTGLCVECGRKLRTSPTARESCDPCDLLTRQKPPQKDRSEHALWREIGWQLGLDSSTPTGRARRKNRTAITSKGADHG